MVKEKATDLKFKVILREAVRIHEKGSQSIENKEIALLKILKKEISEVKKSLEEEFFVLAENQLDAQHFDDFIDQKDKFILLLSRIDTILEENSNSATPVAATSTSLQHNGLKLPKYELIQYSGNLADWLNFKEVFNSSIIQNKNLTQIEKLQYLNSSLRGNALQLIKGFPISGDNFENAWKTLVERYDNKYELANSQINKIFNLKSVKSNSAKSLHELLDTCNEAVRNLENLGYELNKLVELIFVNVLQAKLDEHLRQLFSLSIAKSEEPTYKGLIAFIDKYARSLNSIKESNQKAEQSKPLYRKTVINSAVVPNASQSCSMCQRSHPLHKCEKFLKLPVDQRWTFVKGNNVCFNCLRSNHHVSACLIQATCRHCAHKHHSCLHQTHNTNSVNNAHVNTPNSSHSSPSHHHHQLKSNAAKNSNREKGAESAKGDSEESKTESKSLKCFSSTNESESNCNVLLSTALVKVRSSNGKVKMFRALIDNGSQKSLISKTCCKELNLTLNQSKHTISGINDLIAETSFSEVNIQISAHFNNKWIPLNALVVGKVTTDLPNFTVVRGDWPHLNHFLLADPKYHLTGSVDILLGADLYADLIIGCPIPSTNGSPAAINSRLGFLLCGKIHSKSNDYTPIVSCLANVQIQNELRKFWELEAVPHTKPASVEDQECEKIYSETVKRDSTGRYIVNLPLRPNVNLGDTRAGALRRFFSLERKLANNPKFKEEYIKFMQEYIDLKHMCKISKSDTDEIGCYLPHHGVIRESSATTRLRVVFDASMKSSSGTSLNDNLYIGPKLQADLSQTLIRFRCYPIALSSDIAKMFRQILINPDQCHYQKILWRFSTEDPIDEYKLLTVTYGTSCAPYLSLRTLHQLAKDEMFNYPKASEVVLNNFYVDDLLCGSNFKSEAKNLIQELNLIMKAGGFLLRKWASNCPEVLDELSDDLKSSSSCVDIDESSSLKILGIKWDSVCDTIQINCIKPKDIKSKRQLLSVIARTYDPLGLLSPCTIVLKLLLQDLWHENLRWDDPLPPSVLQTWTQFSSEMSSFHKIRIERCLQSTTQQAVDYQIHGFSDASSRAYAAVVYLKTILKSGDIKVSLIAAKTKVAPSKSITLPRLELCASVLLSELSVNIINILPFSLSSINFYSDSEIVLHWIQNDPAKLSTFVSHRVAQIQVNSAGAQWSHVRSQENPADVASRGIYPDSLVNHTLWWYGPTWLAQGIEPGTISPSHPVLSQTDLECYRKEIKTKPVIFHSAQVLEVFPILSNCSSFSKLVRVFAYCHRFINNSRKSQEKLSGVLSANELKIATHSIIKIIQSISFPSELKLLKDGKALSGNSPYVSLSLFLDSESLIRVGGRLKLSNLPFNEKHPLLIPKSHHLTHIIIIHFHKKSLHAGTSVVLSLIRQNYWIPSGRDKVRQVLKNCVTCLKLNARVSHQLMGDLPKDRLIPTRVFAKVGVDFAGPVVTKPNVPRTRVKLKSYIALFICFATRAVHIELVSDLSTEAFIACLNRFVSRRGLPSDIFSDNGSNFHGADNHLKSVLNMLRAESIQTFVAEKSISWHFNPPSGPHFGGLWEANIKSMKRHISKICNSAVLNFEELSTVLTQVEACLNSRPISALSSDPNDLQPLTPGHFIIGSAMLSLPESTPTCNMCLKSRWALLQKLKHQFWSQWSKDYLQQMQTKAKWTVKSANLKTGDLVLLKSDISTHPLKWNLARVVETFPGSDGVVRVVTLKTASGVLKRPVTKLCPLPVN